MKKTKKHTKARTNQKKIGDKHRMNPNSLKNLKPPYPPGKSGNPAGRPIKNKKMIEKLKEIGNEKYTISFEIVGLSDTNPIKKKDLVLQKIWDRACDGDIACIKFLEERECI